MRASHDEAVQGGINLFLSYASISSPWLKSTWHAIQRHFSGHFLLSVGIMDTLHSAATGKGGALETII